MGVGIGRLKDKRNHPVGVPGQDRCQESDFHWPLRPLPQPHDLVPGAVDPDLAPPFLDLSDCYATHRTGTVEVHD